MRKFYQILMGAMLGILMAPAAQADAPCTIKATCEELGYTKQCFASEQCSEQCSGYNWIVCPLDTTKVACLPIISTPLVSIVQDVLRAKNLTIWADMTLFTQFVDGANVNYYPNADICNALAAKMPGNLTCSEDDIRLVSSATTMQDLVTWLETKLMPANTAQACIREGYEPNPNCGCNSTRDTCPYSNLYFRCTERSLGDGIKLTVFAATTGAKLGFDITGTDLCIDWGDGNINQETSHTYASASDSNINAADAQGFKVNITGNNITTFEVGEQSVGKVTLQNLDLASITKMRLSGFGGVLQGTIPKLPENLKDASHMFENCGGIEGSVELPKTLTDASYMFANSGISAVYHEGPLANKVTGMFKCAKWLEGGTIDMSSSSITDATDMFRGAGIKAGTSVTVKLPPNLQKANYMFFNSKAKAEAATLTNLTEARMMFAGNQAGSIAPDISSAPITNILYMFANSEVVFGDTKINRYKLPNSINYAHCAFAHSQLKWAPNRPNNLTDTNGYQEPCDGMFAMTPICSQVSLFETGEWTSCVRDRTDGTINVCYDLCSQPVSDQDHDLTCPN